VCIDVYVRLYFNNVRIVRVRVYGVQEEWEEGSNSETNANKRTCVRVYMRACVRVYMCVYDVCVCMCVCMCACVCMCLYVCACVHGCVCVCLRL